MLSEDEAAVGLDLDSWKCQPFKPTQNHPCKAGSTTNMGMERKRHNHSLSTSLGDVACHTNRATAYTREREGRQSYCDRMSKGGRNQPQPAPHNQLREGVPQRSPWLLLSPRSRLCGRLLVSLLLPGSPWGLWLWLPCQHTGSDQPAAWIMLSKRGCLQVLLPVPEHPHLDCSDLSSGLYE